MSCEFWKDRFDVCTHDLHLAHGRPELPTYVVGIRFRIKDKLGPGLLFSVERLSSLFGTTTESFLECPLSRGFSLYTTCTFYIYILGAGLLLIIIC